MNSTYIGGFDSVNYAYIYGEKRVREKRGSLGTMDHCCRVNMYIGDGK